MINRLKAALATVLAVATAVPALAVSLPAHAAITSTVIKNPSSSTLYWYASNGKRYVFPNANTFYTWYGDFLNVQNVTDSELAAIPLAGNVTYRPGAKLVKVESDPKVYAVARYGVLRHVTSEYLASTLYGSDWRSKVQDIPAVFFTNYTIGTPIYNAYDFSVANEYNGVANPNDNLSGLTSGTNQTAYGFTLNASRTSINPGEAVELTATAYQYGTSNARIDLYDTRNTSSVIRTCSYASTCTQTVYPQRNGNETTVQYYAVLRDQNGNFITNAYGPVIYFGNVNGTGTTNYGTRFTTTVSRTSVNAGESVTLTATHNGNSSLPSSYRIEIQDPRTASAIQTCWNTSTCSTSLAMTVNGGVTNIIFHVRLLDQYGNLIVDEGFPTISIGNVTQNGTLSLNVSRTSVTVYPGPSTPSTYLGFAEAINLTGSYSGTIPSGGRLEIKDVRTGEILKTCYAATNCAAYAYVSYDAGYTSMQFRISLMDGFGTVLATQYSPTVTVVRSSTYSTQQTGDAQITGLDLVANPTSLASGAYLRLTSNAYNSGNWNYSGNRIEIRDLRTQNVVRTCYDQSWCVAELYPTRNGSESSVSYGVRFYDRNGNFIREATSQTVTFTDNGSTGSTTSYGSLTGSTDLYYAPTAARNTQGYLTAAINNPNLPTRDLLIRLSENGTVLGTCLGGSVCSIARAIGNAAVHTTIRAEFGTVANPAQLTRTMALDVN